jgi:hypothetical protein
MLFKRFENAQPLLLPLLWGFCLFWTLSPFPFPFGNQDPYFFWAINSSLDGLLNADFLAQQPDPFPLVSILFRFIPVQAFPSLSHLLMFGLCVVYTKAAFDILKNQLLAFPILVPSLFLLAHSSFFWSSFFLHFFSLDLRWFWHHGIAQQGLLFGYFQPSAFGVFLLLGLGYFFQEKYRAFLFCLLVAGAFHANYILLGGLVLGIAFVFQPKALWKEKGLFMLLSLVWGAYLLYSYRYFKVDSPAFLEASAYFIQNNPHLDPFNWLNLESILKLAFLLVVFGVYRDGSMGKFLLALLGLTVLLSLLTLASKNVFLVNLAPWRMSVVLMPLALFLGIRKGAEWITARPWNSWFPLWGLLLGALFAESVFRFFGNASPAYLHHWRWLALAFMAIASVLVWGLSRFPKYHTLPAFLVLITAPAFGVVQYTFEKRELRLLPEWTIEKELHAYRPPKPVVLFPLSMKTFRLRSLCPVYIDANVYFSPALPEWKRRQTWNKAFFQNPNRFTAAEIRKEGISHLVCSPELALNDSIWTLKKTYPNLNLYQLHEP